MKRYESRIILGWKIAFFFYSIEFFLQSRSPIVPIVSGFHSPLKFHKDNSRLQKQYIFGDHRKNHANRNHLIHIYGIGRRNNWPSTSQSSSGVFDSAHKLALLIDADNTTPHVMEELMHEVSRFGSVKIKRIYGDWSSPNLSGWRSKIMNHALVPIQQMAYTPGKGNTDSALIIDCMDIFYTEDVTGFCLVSSDSDFTRLALRMREGGKLVLGVGRKFTPKAFVSSCDRFIYVENLKVCSPDDVDEETRKRRRSKLKALTRLLLVAADDTAGNDGWSHLGSVGEALYKVKPDFDPRDYGYKKLYDLVKATDLFDLAKVSHEVKLRGKPEQEDLISGDMNGGLLETQQKIICQQVSKQNETVTQNDFLY